MKKSIMILLFTIIVYGLQAQSCKPVHQGKFKISDNKSGVTVITRNENFQIEENKTLKIKMAFSITWIDDCTYELRPHKVLEGDPSYFIKDMVITTVIKQVKKYGYQAVCTNNLYEGREYKIFCVNAISICI